jgi:type IV secretion system protein VirB8|tara:strand:+ start:2255 stop:2944 length:690 start_codon:yes stop_codon:yes gene_type:complete
MALGVKSKGDLDKYFAEAKSWDHDRAREALRQKRTAYMVAGGGVLFGLGMLIWHIAAPLTSVEPYVLRVDQQTGGVDVVTRLNRTREVTADEAVNKYFLASYVRDREAWMPAAAREMIQKVLYLSSPQEQEKYSAFMRVQNPASPFALYQNGQTVTARINNIAFIANNVAQVRFVKVVSRPGNAPDELSNWIATINYKYVDRPETEAGRLDNPLGFQVISYRADPEIVQ